MEKVAQRAYSVDSRKTETHANQCEAPASTIEEENTGKTFFHFHAIINSYETKSI